MRALTINRMSILFGAFALLACSGAVSDTASPSSALTVALRLSSDSVVVGATVAAEVSVRDAAGKLMSGRAPIFSSSSAANATVDAQGTVTGVAPGSASITATLDGKSATAPIRVIPLPVRSLQIASDNGNAFVYEGNTLQLSATAKDANGAIVLGRSAAWTSSNTAAATVGAGGLVSAQREGTSTVSAVIDGVTASLNLQIRAKPVAVRWDRILVPGLSQTLRDVSGLSNDAIAVGDAGTIVRVQESRAVQVLTGIRGNFTAATWMTWNNGQILMFGDGVYDFNTFGGPSRLFGIGEPDFIVRGESESPSEPYPDRSFLAVGWTGGDGKIAFCTGGSLLVCRTQIVKDYQFNSVISGGITGLVVGNAGKAVLISSLTSSGGLVTDLSSGIPVDLFGIYRTREAAFAVGAGGRILKMSGYPSGSWSEMTSPTRNTLRAIAGVRYGPDFVASYEMYAVGDNGTILFFDGVKWTQMASGTSENLYGIRVWANQSPLVPAALVVGANGLILRGLR